MIGDGWALTGRDAERRVALDLLEAPPTNTQGLVISGPPGIGKSRLAAEVLDALPADRVVRRVIATHTAIPFSTFAHLLEHDRTADVERLEPPDLLWAMRRIRARLAREAGGSTLVLAVDDAHLLDEASAALVQQLTRSGEVVLLATVRTGAPCPAPITSLWRDQTCDHLELQALSRAELGELVAAVLGRWLEQTSLDHLFATCAGNPLVLRELLADAEASGGLTEHRGLLRWRGVGGSARLAALVEADLDRLDAEARAFMDVLAVGEPVPVEVARSLTSLGALAALERDGFVTVDQLGDLQVRLGHPLFGEVRRSQLGPLQVAATERALADAFERAGRDHDDDRLRVVCWRTTCGEDVSGPLLLDAAGHARARGDAVLAERLARAARSTGPSPAVDLLLAELAEVTGRAAEAATLLDGLAPMLERDDQRARALTTQIRVLAHVLGRPLEAERAARDADLVQDPVWRGFVRAQWATTLAMLGEVDEAGSLGAELFAHPDERVRLRALPAVNLPAYTAGRLDAGLAAAQTMIGPALAWRDEVPVGLSVVFSALALDLLALGRLDEVDQLLELATDPVAALPSSRAYLLAVEGSVSLRRGSVGEARRQLSEAVELFGDADPQGFRAASLALLAEALAHGGDARASAGAAQDAASTMGSRPFRLVDLDSRRAGAWAQVAAGDPAGARRDLLAVADEARSAGHLLFEMTARHDAVRLGSGRRVQRRLAAVASRIDGERAAAIAAQARALLAGDPAALGLAGERFAELGELLVAAEVIGEASRQHERAGQQGAARRTAARARALYAGCVGATAPAALPAPGPRLTPRELQVARLAASGSSSRDIARELAVSVRTIDNQLSRTYTKLGIGGRDELPGALADAGADREGEDEIGPTAGTTA